MIYNIIMPRICKFDECTTRSTFGLPGKKAEFCSKHSTADMINVISKTCKFDGCTTQPTFGLPGKKAEFCKTHATADMVNVKDKTCKFDGCTTRSTFGLPGKKAEFCSKHSTADMINVISKTCKFDGCTTLPIYGLPGQKIAFCSKHRSPGMIKRSKSKCKVTKCREIATFGKTDLIPIHCETHKLDDELNLVERKCTSCGLMMILDVTNKCEFCNPETFKTVALAKQTAIMQYLDERPDLPVPLSTDKIIEGGSCGKERPDRIYDLIDKILVIECDEHQHKNRACLCEQTRMINIGQSFGGLPTYFIRWNPDNYNPKDSKKEPEPMTTRNKLLGDLIHDISTKRIILPHSMVCVLYLYYDGWQSLFKERWQTLLAYDKKGIVV